MVKRYKNNALNLPTQDEFEKEKRRMTNEDKKRRIRESRNKS